MERTYQIHQSYPFKFIGLIESEGKQFLEVTDGYYNYQIIPFEFQLNEAYRSSTSEIYCFVKYLTNFAKPFLIQSRKEVLAHQYNKPHSEYPFIVKAIKIDENSQQLFYELKDIYGINHRYYVQSFEPAREVDDIIMLTFKGIEARGMNKAHLVLECPKDLILPIEEHRSPERGKFGSENENLEFKSSIVYTNNSTANIDRQIGAVIRAIAGFMNKSGGRLLIGIHDNGTMHGIESDFPHLNDSSEDDFSYLQNEDGYENKIRNMVKIRLGATANSHLKIKFQKENNKTYCEILVKEMERPVYFDREKIFQRAGNTTQQLKGEDITYFIEQRLKRYRDNWISPLSGSQPAISFIDRDFEKPSDQIIAQEQFNLKTTSVQKRTEARPRIWAYLTFFNNGNWSYQKTPKQETDIIYQIAVSEDMKSQRLLMVYNNGSVNVVIPEEMCYTNTYKGMIQKTMGKRYKNGWNTNSKLLSMHLAKPEDYVLFTSIDAKGIHYYKVHQVDHIAVHTTLFCEGNMLINKKFRAKLTKMELLDFEEAKELTPIQLKKHQTSTHLGFSEANLDFMKEMKGLENRIRS